MAKKSKRNKDGWNYRIVCRVWIRNGKKFSSYGVHEVYYTNDKPTSMTQDETSPGGESELEFWQSTIYYVQAFGKPILYFDMNKSEFIKKI